MRKSILINYLQLLRPQGAAATSATILIGSIVMGLRDIFLLFILFILGILIHVCGFVLNEYIDVEVDKKSKDLQKKPLVSGTVPKKHALLIVIILAFFSYLLTIFYFPTIYPLIFLSLTLLSGCVYDLFGKKIPGSDVFAAGACFFVFLFGAGVVSIEFTNLIFIIGFACFFHIIFNNAVEGGLKDIDHDFIAGAKTTAIRLGIYLNNGKLVITKKFSFFAYSIKFFYIGLVVLAGFQPEINLWASENYLIQIIFIVMVFIVLATLYKFWHPPDFDRPRLIRIFAVHEIFAYFLGPVILLPLIGIKFVLLLLLLPFFWFILCNLIIYQKLIQPQV